MYDGYQAVDRTQFCMDRQTDLKGKTICPLTLKGGDKIIQHAIVNFKK